ncbi:hypothetical protein CYMTET_28228 [Cymbomonas tetramitiformis]|uniref:Uncharacterized protein n=1 Tax=Cymbomonas tetramitiformis TaxID=36881 RepID=A0AAE0FNF5_9CHLO|nr:hypothetical protein CYMTET_28228 [Cymbomonas tetramitiformis]
MADVEQLFKTYIDIAPEDAQAEEHLAEEAPQQLSQSDEKLQKAAEEASLKDEPTHPRPPGQEAAFMQKGVVVVDTTAIFSKRGYAYIMDSAPTWETPDAGSSQAANDKSMARKKLEQDETLDTGGNTDEEGAAVDVEDDDEAENEDDKAAEIDNEEAGKEDDEEDDEQDAGGDDTAGTPQRSGKTPKRAITSFVMEDDEEIASPSKTPKTAEENQENEKEKQAARRK